jgi:hypothetical protein
LKEVQKYWKVNNLVLDFFFQYLDESTAKILLTADTENIQTSPPAHTAERPSSLTGRDTSTTQSVVSNTRQQHIQYPTADPLEDQFWNFLRTNWEGDDNTDNGDLGFLWDAQLYANFDFLEKCL